jgi:hypothetical protein
VKRDKHTAAIVLWELFFIVVGHRIRRPVRRKCCDRSDLVGANADRFPAVPTVLWGEDKLLHELVVVALGPAIVAPLLQQQQFFCRERRFLIGLKEVGPIRMQLVSSVLRYERAPSCVDGKAFGVTDSRCEALSRRKNLIRFLRVIEPNPPASLQFRAGIDAGRFECPILDLARIGGGCDIDVHGSFGIDDEWMHGVIAA